MQSDAGYIHILYGKILMTVINYWQIGTLKYWQNNYHQW